MEPARVIVPEIREERKLDIKDRKIIEVLSRNSRTPITRIAKILSYSKEVVKYRIDKLVKDNVITDFFAVIDSSKLGYNKFNIYLEFYTLSKEDEGAIIDYLMEHPNVSWVITTSGKWDFMIQIYTKTITELDLILMSISSKFVNLLKEYELYVITQFHHIRPKFISEKVELENVRNLPYASELTSKSQEEVNIDKQDVKILKLLEQDSRMHVLDIGRELNLSKEVVQYRIKKLIKQKIITDFTLRINWGLLGYQYYSVLLKLKDIDEKKRRKMIDYLKTRKEVIAVFVQIGHWNLCVQSIVKNAIELKKLISEIKELFKDIIEDNESVLYFNQYRFTYLPKSIMDDFEVERLSAAAKSRPQQTV